MGPKPYTQSTQTSTSRTLRSTIAKQASSSKAKGVIQIEQASTSKSNCSATATKLKIFCIVENKSTSCPVDILDSETVCDLKKEIKKEKKPELDKFAADELTLWRAEIPNRDEKRAILLKDITEKQELVHERAPLSSLGELTGYDTYIIVKPPQQVPKRNRDEETAESDSKRVKLEPNNPCGNMAHEKTQQLIYLQFIILLFTAQKHDREEDDNIGKQSESVSKKYRSSTSSSGALVVAIEKAGFTKKAIIENEPDLSFLSMKERAKVLSFIGEASRNSSYHNITRTARELLSSKADMKEINVLTSPGDRDLPVVETVDLFIRDEYKRLYDHIISDFRIPTTVGRLNRFFITGTPGIGKSAFLVYFAIRQLVDHDQEDPPIIIFHEKKSETCYAYGGTTCQRKGKKEEFASFLELPETWYLVDSGNNPQPDRARTIFSASPKTLYDQYDEFAKGATGYSYYHMSPWNLEELRE
ncbi:hypothetical protein BGX20_005771, partial [Mortierella sp. AD010]